jgi:hypothetical protein
MISLTRKDVPQYLQNSEFYKALDEDDGAIMIPKECFVKDTLVNNFDDLTLLLSTLRFWGVNEIPFDVIKYVMWQKPASVVLVLDRFRQELRYVEFLEALRTGTTNAFGEGTVSSLSVYYGLRTREWSSCRMRCAAEICLVQYEHEEGNIWDATTCKLAARHGLLDALAFLYEHGCPWDKRCCESAADASHLPCLQYAHEHGCPWDEDVLLTAVTASNMDAVRYAHGNGCPWHISACTVAVKYHQDPLECLQYAYEHGCPWNADATTAAARMGKLEALQYLHEHGCAWTTRCCIDAAMFGQLECLVYAHEHGCPWDAGICTSAAGHGHLECLRYAHENGCPWDETTIKCGLAGRKWACVEYAHAHGCPWDVHACSEGVRKLMTPQFFGAPRPQPPPELLPRALGVQLDVVLQEQTPHGGAATPSI